MKLDKNMLKDNNRVESKSAKKSEFYAIIEVKVKTKDGSGVKSFVETSFGTRLQAKQDLEKVAKVSNGTITYFSAFK